MTRQKDLLHISRESQSGTVLMVSMIVLLLLSMIGISGSQTTNLEEKMAGNDYDRNIAFQAAEEALRSGEIVIDGLINLSSFDGTQNAVGRFSQSQRPDHTLNNTWNNSSAQAVRVMPLVATQPRFFIHYLGNQPSDPLDPSSDPISIFRIVARGTGRKNTSRVLLQAYIGRQI